MTIDRRQLLGGLVGLSVMGCSVLRGGAISHQPGTLLETRKVGRREYLLFHPRPEQKKPMPLMFCFHGGGTNAEHFAVKAEIAKATSQFPMILVFPDGTEEPGGKADARIWNSGHSPSGLTGGANDVAYVSKILAAVKAAHKVDDERVFALGFSNGGMMSYRLAAEKSDVFRAIGIIGGSVGGKAAPDQSSFVNDPRVAASRPVNVFHIHGMKDTSVHVGGGPTSKPTSKRVDLALREAAEMWVEHNQTKKKVPKAFPTDELWRSTSGTGGSEVRVKVLSNRGHNWLAKDLLEMVDFFFECER